MKAFWWVARRNFGDALTPLLLSAFSGVQASWTMAETADVVVVGSVLEFIPDAWTGIIAGAGKLREETNRPLSYADVRGLRGALSAKGVKGDFALGDPGLLVDELVPTEPGKYDLGVVPHWSDRDLEHKFAQWKPKVIYPNQDPLVALKEIGSCKKIVASSLHGIIAADSFGIPRRAELFPRAAAEGGDFKFRDYSSAIGLPVEFGKLQTPERWRIEAIQRELYDMFGGLA